MGEKNEKSQPRISLMGKIGIGFGLGIVVGLIFGPNVSWIEPIGEMFIRLLQMIVFPLVFFALINGLTQVSDVSKMARMGLKTIVLYLSTTAIAIAIGLAFANFFKPGDGVEIDIGASMEEVDVEPPSLLETIMNLVPTNPFTAFAEGEILPVIVFAIFVGVSIVTLTKETERLKVANAVEILNNIMNRMVSIIIQFAPYGVFALIAGVVGNQGMDILIPLLKLILVVYGAILVHILIVQMGFLVWLWGKVSPLKFFKSMLPAATFAYATDSSAATLPITMKNAEERLKISKSTSSFVIPLGATINMDGSAIYQGVVAIFLAQLLGLDLTFTQQLIILGTALLASIGTAGVPAASLIMLTMTLTAAGIPVEAIGIVAGVDRIIGGARTVANIFGDAAVALIVDRTEAKT